MNMSHNAIRSVVWYALISLTLLKEVIYIYSDKLNPCSEFCPLTSFATELLEYNRTFRFVWTYLSRRPADNKKFQTSFQSFSR